MRWRWQVVHTNRTNTHIEVPQHATAKIGSARRVIMLEQFVEAFLAHQALKPAPQKAGHNKTPAAETVAEQLLKIDAYGAGCGHVMTS